MCGGARARHLKKSNVKWPWKQRGCWTALETTIFSLSTVIIWGKLLCALDELLDLEHAAGSAVKKGLVACLGFVSHSSGGGLSLGEEHSKVMSVPPGRWFKSACQRR